MTRVVKEVDLLCLNVEVSLGNISGGKNKYQKWKDICTNL